MSHPAPPGACVPVSLPPDLGPAERRLAERLARHHVGKGRAVTGERLAELLGLARAGEVDLSPARAKRRAQLIVEALVEVHRLPVLSSSAPDGGYYWPGTWEEVWRAYASMAQRAESTVARARALLATIPLDERQGKLFAGEMTA